MSNVIVYISNNWTRQRKSQIGRNAYRLVKFFI